MREQDRLDADTQRKIQETLAKIEEIKASTTLKLEQAETEQVTNQIDVYTVELQAIQNISDRLTSIGEANARTANIRDQGTTQ